MVCFLPFVLQEESHQEILKAQWTQAQGPTARPKYLATWHWPSDCFQTVQKERIQDPYTFYPISPTPDCEPQLFDPLDSRWRADRLLEAGTNCVLPSAGLRFKAIFLFAPNSVSVNFIWLPWAEKTKISVETMPLSLAGSPPLLQDDSCQWGSGGILCDLTHPFLHPLLIWPLIVEPWTGAPRCLCHSPPEKGKLQNCKVGFQKREKHLWLKKAWE